MTVTPLYAGLLALFYLYLTSRVIRFRRGRRVDMGDAGDPLLQRLIRAHANFAEYAPFGLLLLLLVEQGGWPGWLVHLLGLMLLAGRLSHGWAFSVAELREGTRVAGMVLTTTMLGLAAVLCLVRALGLA
jgi:uncharacterized membrane protein YecN with MAPEG domain